MPGTVCNFGSLTEILITSSPNDEANDEAIQRADFGLGKKVRNVLDFLATSEISLPLIICMIFKCIQVS